MSFSQLCLSCFPSSIFPKGDTHYTCILPREQTKSRDISALSTSIVAEADQTFSINGDLL